MLCQKPNDTQCLLHQLGEEFELPDDAICSLCQLRLSDFDQRAHLVGRALRERQSGVSASHAVEHVNLDSDSEGNSLKAPGACSKATFDRTIGDYQLIREIGRGGMGIVYEAKQRRLGRRVALKVLPDTMFQVHSASERFEREATAAANLHHTNIVPVFEFGRDNDVHYYSMQLIEGCGLDVVRESLKSRSAQSKVSTLRAGQSETLSALPEGDSRSVTAEELTELTAPEPLAAVKTLDEGTTAVRPRDCPAPHTSDHYQWVARVGIQVAEALEYAHLRGIVHRDVKPANLLQDDLGTVWLADFGLAKGTDDDLTATSEAPGTLRYMAPERFQGETSQASDIYSLGMTLYELVTLRPALQASDSLKLLDKIKSEKPISPRKIAPNVPHDLQTIIESSIEKDVARRYQSAQALADDLQRFLNGDPIQTRRVSTFERLWLWSKKNVAFAGSLLTLALFLISGTVASTLAAVVFQSQSNANAKLAADKTALASEKAAETNKAMSQRNLAWQNAYFADMRQSQQDWENGNTRQMLKTLRDYLPNADLPDVRGWEWYYLLSLAHQDKATMLDHEGTATRLEWSVDGEKLVSLGTEGTIRVWDCDGLLIRKIAIPGVHAFDLNPDSTQFVAVCGDETLRFFDVESGNLVRTIRNEFPLYERVQWSADGKQIIACHKLPDGNRELIALQLDTDKVSFFAKPIGTVPVSVVELVGNSTMLLHANSGRSNCQVFDLEQRTFVSTFGAHEFQPMCGAWHPDGRRFAVGAYLQGLRLFEHNDKSSAPKLIDHLHNYSSVDAVAFSPDGTKLYIGNRGQRIEVYDLDEREFTGSIKGHLAPIRAISVHPNNELIATSADDGSVKIWDVTTRSQPQKPSTPTKSGVSEDGNFRWDMDGFETIVSNMRTGKHVARLEGMAAGFTKAKFFPKSNLAVFWWPGGTTHFFAWDMKTWLPVPQSPKGYWQPSVDVKGDVAAVCAWTGYIHCFNGRTGEVNVFQPHRILDEGTHVKLSPDAKSLLTALNGEISLWDVGTCQEIAHFYGHRPDGFISVIKWGHSGKYFASGSVDQTVKIWNAETQKLQHTFHMQATPFPRVFGFSFDDSRFIASDPQGARVWDVESGRELLAFEINDADAVLKDFQSENAKANLALKDSSLRFDALAKAEPVGNSRAGVERFEHQALHQLARSILIDPENVVYAPARGLQLATRALELNPTDPVYLWTHGLACYRAEKIEEAKSSLKLASDSGWHDRHELHFLMALCSHHAGAPEEAKRELETANTLLEPLGRVTKDDIPIVREAIRLVSDRESGLSVAEQFVREFDLPIIQARATRLLYASTPSEESLQTCRELITTMRDYDPKNPLFAVMLGHVEYKLQNHDSAVEILQEVTSADIQEKPIVYFLLAACLKKQGKSKEAHEAYANANRLVADAESFDSKYRELIHAIAKLFLADQKPNEESTIVVTTLEDNLMDTKADQMSLREAVASVPEGGKIVFNDDLLTKDAVIELKLGPIMIERSMTIEGPGFEKLAISGGGKSRLLIVHDGNPDRLSDVYVNKLRLTGGRDNRFVSGAHGEWQAPFGSIFCNESLTISDCLVDNNHLPTSAAGAVYLEEYSKARIERCTFLRNSSLMGGAIFSCRTSELIVDACTFEGNIENPGQSPGAAIYCGGSLVLTNSTFAKNIAKGEGGALALTTRNSIARVSHCTFSENIGGAIYSYKFPVASMEWDIEVTNCIFYGNTDKNNNPLDIWSKDGVQAKISHSIIGTNLGGFIDEGNNLIGVDPKLGPFDNHGGPRKTYSLLEASPAIDAGITTDLDFDGRGEPFKRTIDGDDDLIPRPDIGAYEYSTSG